MSATVTMWLGIAFVVLGILAVVLQAWLWGYPFDKETRTSAAPKPWVLTHRIIGFTYAAIYVVMMIEMVPRLWEYQVELPARTVLHAALGVTIGVLLIIKLLILRFFRHFEEAMPTLGVTMLVCTIIMGFLSIPYSLKAHAYTGDTFAEANRARTRAVLGDVDFGREVDLDDVTSVGGLETGQRVLTGKCAACHDLRTVLIKPRSGDAWHDVVARMAQRPTPFERITDDEVLFVTAYLVAITPELQQSMKVAKAEERAKEETAAKVAQTPTVAAAGDVGAFDPAAVKPVVEKECTPCHSLKDLDEHGPDTADGWRKVVTRMIEENEAEIDAPTANKIVEYLAVTYPKK